MITSTAKDLYKRDMLNVCCKPTDDLISFSYGKDRITSVPADVTNQQVLIVFAAYQETTPKFTFHPIRYCTIQEAISNSENASFTYHLKLGACVSYKYKPGDPHINDVLITNFDTEFKNQLAAPESVDKLDFYFRSMNFTTQLKSAAIEETGVWPNLAKHLGNLKAFEESVFFRLLAPRSDIDFREKDLSTPPPIPLRPGKLYTLNFLIITGSKVKGSGIYPTIQTDSNLSVQGPFISQESNAVALRYILITKSSSASLYSSFLMRAAPPKDQTSPVSPEISSYLAIKPHKWRGLASFLLIVLGLISANIVDLMPKEKTFEFLGLFTFKGGQLANVIKVIASTAFAIGSYFVYRNLPKP